MRTPGNSANTETGFLNPALPGLSGDSLLASGSEASTDRMPTGPPAGSEDVQVGAPPLQLRSPANAEDKTRQESLSDEATSTHTPLMEHGNETPTMWAGAAAHRDSGDSRTQTEGPPARRGCSGDRALAYCQTASPSTFLVTGLLKHSTTNSEELFHTENMTQKSSPR